MKKFIFAALLGMAISAPAQTTQFEADAKRLYDVIYWPILNAVVACSRAKYPDPVKRKQCEGNLATSGIRFVTDAQGKAEAREGARFHAGLLARNGIYKIVDDAATDPWTSWRCLAPTCNPGTNQEVIAKSSVRSYVVDADGNVYDHRMRYFIPPFYATKLGKINPRFSVTMWNARKGQLGDILSQQK